MFHTADEFIDFYGWESACTGRVLAALTPAALTLAKAEGHPTLGEIAWHIAAAPLYIMSQAGYDLPTPQSFFADGAGPDGRTPASLTPALIAATQKDIAARVLAQSKAKSADDLKQVFHVFGAYDWALSQMMQALIAHEIHHRGQLSVLMRQAGLVVPPIYGPSYEQTK
ncbi:DinB family protein [bacterium]|nr:DinB family protein [bacterium]